MYELHQNLPLLYWRGRWTTEKSLVFYLQDALTRRSLGELPDSVKERLLFLESLYPAMIKCY